MLEFSRRAAVEKQMAGLLSEFEGSSHAWKQACHLNLRAAAMPEIVWSTTPLAANQHSIIHLVVIFRVQTDQQVRRHSTCISLYTLHSLKAMCHESWKQHCIWPTPTPNQGHTAHKPRRSWPDSMAADVPCRELSSGFWTGACLPQPVLGDKAQLKSKDRLKDTDAVVRRSVYVGSVCWSSAWFRLFHALYSYIIK